MDTLLDRFCRYVRIDTQANESAGTYPSSPGQLELARILADELGAIGARDAATPNLSCGEHNLHSPLEWTCLEEMAAAVRVLVELAQVWADEK